MSGCAQTMQFVALYDAAGTSAGLYVSTPDPLHRLKSLRMEHVGVGSTPVVRLRFVQGVSRVLDFVGRLVQSDTPASLALRLSFFARCAART